MGKHRNKSKLLKRAQSNAREAQKKMTELKATLKQELKDKDPSAADIISKVFETQFAQVQQSISNCNKQCNKINSTVRRQNKEKQKIQTQNTKSRKQKLREKKEKREKLKAAQHLAQPETNRESETPQISIRILSWKTVLEGADLSDRLTQTNADIVLLQGTHLASLYAIPKGYTLFHNPSNNGSILVRNNITAEEIKDLGEGKDMQFQSVLIKLSEKEEFALTNIASPVTSSFNPGLLNCVHQRHLIGGDFGALHKDWNCGTTNEAGEVIQKFKEEHKYKKVPQVLHKSQQLHDPERHGFFLISPHLLPDFVTWNNQVVREIPGSPLLLTWTLTPETKLPANSIVIDEHSPQIKLRRQLSKRFGYLWKTQCKAGRPHEKPLFPKDIQIPAGQVDTCQRFWEGLYRGRVRELPKILKVTLKKRFAIIWRRQCRKDNSFQLPLFPQDIHIPPNDMDKYVEYWEGLWRESVELQIEENNAINRIFPEKGRPKRNNLPPPPSIVHQNRFGPTAIPGYIPFVAAGETAVLADGIVTQVSGTFGYLFAKDYGNVFIPLKAVLRATSNIDDMHMYLNVGDNVRFRAQPQPPTNNCQWAATYVELGPDIPLIHPDILRDKAGVVTKIAPNGKYAFIKSDEHGTVFCPGSACNSQGELGQRLDQVFKVGDKVQFTAHAQPEKSGGVGWLAVTVTMSALPQHEYSVATDFQHQNFWQPQEEARRSVSAWQSQGHQAIPQSGNIKDYEQWLEQQDAARYSGSVRQEQALRQAKHVAAQFSQVRRVNQQDAWHQQGFMTAGQQVSSQWSHTIQHEAADSSRTVWQQQGFQAPQQMPFQTSQISQTVDQRGIVLSVSKYCAIVSTEQLGDVTCRLSSWMSHNVTQQHTISLLDVLNVGEFVHVKVTKDTPGQTWRAVELFKPESQR